MSLLPDSLEGLKELLETLRAAGVSDFETPDLTLRLGRAPKPVVAPNEEADWLDIEKRLRQQEQAEAKREHELQFAHVPGGAPPFPASSDSETFDEN